MTTRGSRWHSVLGFLADASSLDSQARASAHASPNRRRANRLDQHTNRPKDSKVLQAILRNEPNFRRSRFPNRQGLPNHKPGSPCLVHATAKVVVILGTVGNDPGVGHPVLRSQSRGTAGSPLNRDLVLPNEAKWEDLCPQILPLLRTAAGCAEREGGLDRFREDRRH